jgi:TolB-like protein
MVLLLDLTASDVTETEKRLLTNDVAFALSQYPELNVVTQDDIKQMIDVEAEKQALGCDTASCLSEIAGAMGAQYIVFGGVIQTGERYQADLNLFDSRSARAVARERVRGAKVEEVSDGMPAAIDRLIGPLGVESRVSAQPAVDEDAGLPVLGVIGAGVASVGALGAIGFGVLVGAAELQLGSSGEAVKAGDRELWTSLGWVGLIGAGASTVALLAGAGLAGASFVVE